MINIKTILSNMDYRNIIWIWMFDLQQNLTHYLNQCYSSKDEKKNASSVRDGLPKKYSSVSLMLTRKYLHDMIWYVSWIPWLHYVMRRLSGIHFKGWKMFYNRHTGPLAFIFLLKKSSGIKFMWLPDHVGSTSEPFWGTNTIMLPP